MTSSPDPTVVDNVDRNQFELSVDGTLVGHAAYRREGDRIVLTHTEIADEFEGHGLGSVLIGAALEAARREQLQVTPVCPFVVAYLHRHPEDVDLVDDEHRAQFDDDRT